MGRLTIDSPFSIAMLNYQTVNALRRSVIGAIKVLMKMLTAHIAMTLLWASPEGGTPVVVIAIQISVSEGAHISQFFELIASGL